MWMLLQKVNKIFNKLGPIIIKFVLPKHQNKSKFIWITYISELRVIECFRS